MSAHISSFLPLCLSLIEKAQSQVTQNNLLTSEALSAALLLAIYLSNDMSNGLNF
jgi:hypothetical protein